ncbi:MULTISPECIES: 4-hydroxy-tetrahydrodipicolinate synthase [unclassified Synechocystis]|uniref:4-hydroxy-tetrahydrodipicolinate synthase n=1 Tax=unclassified Synechocystis TaxID=2640012 RepID=UPI00041D694B|nr:MULTISPECIES: 4-hydroxy-tetrahydrodipicolinate synthase [unclassified Synechocystis]AIE75288.1 Dihydrodipicolinate synthase [Synechocystis sp. PCC 6714]MCT0253029.1 4-hydroxy-tetrahydrodipicolinate synthase [Synechocystis sp. CS-94]
MADFVNASPFGPILTAMITPFNAEGGVDYGVAEKLADHLITHGSDGLVVCGTTGESPTLSWEEEHELFRVIKQTVGDRGSVIAGTGSNCTREAMEATQIAAKLGVDGSLQVVPYYNKPPQEGLLAHFQAIASCAPELPLMLYNIPGRTGQSLAPETVYRLAEVENIVAIKEATGSLEQASLIRVHTPDDFAIYAGDDVLTLPMLAVGGAGVVSVASHLVGDRLQTMVRHFAQGATNQALEIHLQLIPLFKILFCATNPIPVKTALGLQGWSVGSLRPPLCALSPSQIEQLQTVLENLALLS